MSTKPLKCPQCGTVSDVPLARIVILPYEASDESGRAFVRTAAARGVAVFEASWACPAKFCPARTFLTGEDALLWMMDGAMDGEPMAGMVDDQCVLLDYASIGNREAFGVDTQTPTTMILTADDGPDVIAEAVGAVESANGDNAGAWAASWFEAVGTGPTRKWVEP